MVTEADKARYRTRKGDIAVNVLGVCDRNMKFIYMLSGWEGSAADCRVLRLKVPQGTISIEPFTTCYYIIFLNIVIFYFNDCKISYKLLNDRSLLLMWQWLHKWWKIFNSIQRCQIPSRWLGQGFFHSTKLSRILQYEPFQGLQYHWKNFWTFEKMVGDSTKPNILPN